MIKIGIKGVCKVVLGAINNIFNDKANFISELSLIQTPIVVDVQFARKLNPISVKVVVSVQPLVFGVMEGGHSTAVFQWKLFLPFHHRLLFVKPPWLSPFLVLLTVLIF